MRHLTGLTKWMHLARAIGRSGFEPFPPSFILYATKLARHLKLTELNGTLYIDSRYPPLETEAWRTSCRALSGIRRGEQPLMSMGVSLTRRCPFDCVYCCERGGRVGPELSTERMVRLVREAQDLGAFSVNFTGGESLCREDLPELIAAVDERAMARLATSGYRFAERGPELVHAGLDCVVISLDTFDEAAYNRVRGHPDAFRTAIDAIEAAVALGLYTALNVFVDRPLLEADTFDAFVRRAGRLGVHEIVLLSPKPCVRLGRKPEFPLSPRDNARLFRYQTRYNHDASLPTVTAFDWTESDACQGCGGGSTYIHVTSDGEVSTCPYTPVSFGSIVDRPLVEVYAEMRRLMPVPGPRCQLDRLFGMIADVPDDELPVRDPQRLREAITILKGPGNVVPEFWRSLGMRRPPS